LWPKNEGIVVVPPYAQHVYFKLLLSVAADVEQLGDGCRTLALSLSQQVAGVEAIDREEIIAVHLGRLVFLTIMLK